MTAAVVLAAYDPSQVKPGWIALVLVVSLGVATYLLWRSMNTQLRKIQAPPKDTGLKDTALPGTGPPGDGPARPPDAGDGPPDAGRQA